MLLLLLCLSFEPFYSLKNCAQHWTFINRVIDFEQLNIAIYFFDFLMTRPTSNEHNSHTKRERPSVGREDDFLHRGFSADIIEPNN